MLAARREHEQGLGFRVKFLSRIEKKGPQLFTELRAPRLARHADGVTTSFD